MFGAVFVAALLTTAAAWPSGEQHQANYKSNELIIPTTSGQVSGKIDPSFPNVRQFLGIPFAKPPVGDLRWAAPQELLQSDVEIEATELPPSCPQFLGTRPGVFTREVLEFNLGGLNETGRIAEDCLTLSVWTPKGERCEELKGKGLPVLIYIYGGGFANGGQDVPYQIPTQWVDRSPNHIVVSFNYRLNIFGFPSATDLPDQNLGLLDQRAAVEWVRKNIAQFGGNPEQMILFGQSAGSASVDFYNFAYPTDPIVKGFIMHSGTAYLPLRGDATGSNFSYVADQVGCEGHADSPAEQLACMRSVPFETINTFIANYSNSGASPSLSFGPIADEKSFFSNYTERALAKKQANLPAIIGTNREDGVALAPYTPTGPNTTLADLSTLNTFFCPATETLRLRRQTGLVSYRFLYAGNFSNVSPRTWLAAYHGSDLPLVFGTYAEFRGEGTELEGDTSVAMQDSWVEFARDPEAGLRGVGWRVYDVLGERHVVREFGDGVSVKDVSVAGTEGRCDGVSAAAGAA